MFNGHFNKVYNLLPAMSSIIERRIFGNLDRIDETVPQFIQLLDEITVHLDKVFF